MRVCLFADDRGIAEEGSAKAGEPGPFASGTGAYAAAVRRAVSSANAAKPVRNPPRRLLSARD